MLHGVCLLTLNALLKNMNTSVRLFYVLQEPEDRPTFAEIHRMLTEFGADYSDPA